MPLKLLDYGDPKPFTDIIGRPRWLAWPTDAYRVTLPKVADDGQGLNPFERVIFQLLTAAGPMSADTLAYDTCIPSDLVQCILLRLRDKALIDEHGKVVSDVNEDGSHHFLRQPEFITALLFRELSSGKFLPFLHVLNETKPLCRKEGDKYLREIRHDAVHRNKAPSPRDVMSALRSMEKRLKAFGAVEKLPAVQQITIAPVPELYYLHCPIAFQKQDGEFRIGDPFGKGFSLILEHALEQLLERDADLGRWLGDWKASLAGKNRPRTEGLESSLKEPFETAANWRRFPKLVANLRPTQGDNFRSISKIHASLEWGLFYNCCSRPFETAVAQLKLEEPAKHQALLENAALGIGLELQDFQFRPIRVGKLIDFEQGKAEWGTVLAIGLLQAAADTSHPFHRLAVSHPDCLPRLFAIKKKRDKKAHGAVTSDARDAALSDDLFMREMIHVLLPDILFPDSPADAGIDRDARADALLDARASMQGEFGFGIFNQLGANLQNRLVHAERFWRSCGDRDDARSFVDDLYAAIQSAFEKRLARQLPPDVSDAMLFDTAAGNAVEAGFTGEFPRCLRTVKSLAVRQTLQGVPQTLGACAVAWLLMADSQTLSRMADMHPAFIDDIAHIVNQRGHGNEPLPLARTDIQQLRKAGCTIIKILLEV